MKLLNLIGVAVLLAPSAVLAQTVTVNKTATANGTTVFNSISAALAVSPDVIEITDSEVYEEVITITAPVDIVGTEEERPTIAVVANPDGGKMSYSTSTDYNEGGIVINLPDTMTTGAVKLHNLVILPQKGVAVADRLRTAIENQNNNLYLELDNVLLTANNGNDEPLSPNGLVSLVASFLPSHGSYNANHVPFGANGIVLGRASIPNGAMSEAMYEGDGVELLIKDSIVTHFRNDYITADPERFPKAIQMNNPYTSNSNPDPNIRRVTRVEGESIISHSRVGMELAGDLIMKSDGQRIVMIGHATQSLDFTGPAVNERTIEDMIMTNNAAQGIWDRGHGQVRFTLRNCINFFSLNTPILVSGAAVGTILIEDSTIVGGRNHPTAGKAFVFDIRAGTTCDIVVVDSILGGKENHSQPTMDPGLSQTRDFNVFSYVSTNTLTLNGSAMIGEGPYSFRVSETGDFLGYNEGPNADRIGEASTHADPQFVNVAWNDPLNPDFLDVVNSAYATASSTGGPLGGGADYVGVSNVSNWSIY